MTSNRSIYWLTTPKPKIKLKDGDYGPYKERNAILRRLFNQSYEQYLHSSLWAGIRSRVLQRDQHRCLICLHKADEVHHTHYTQANLQGASLAGLMAICQSCHHAIEHDESGAKVPPNEVADRLSMQLTLKAAARNAVKRESRKAKKRKQPKHRQKNMPNSNPAKQKRPETVICVCDRCGVSVVLDEQIAYAWTKAHCHHANCDGLMQPQAKPNRSSSANTP